MAIIPQTKFETIPVGEYEVEVVDALVEDGKFGEQVQFTVQVVGGDHDGKMLKAWTSCSFNPKSKLYGWASALFGAAIPDDYDLNTDQLIGRRARAVVLVKEKTDGQLFNKIDALWPLNSPQSALPGVNNGQPKAPDFPPKPKDDIPW